MKTVAHYCQKCLAANPLGRESCARCGTRLMLIVEPPAARFEASGNVAGLAHEEHLLERVSALENMLLRMAERMERALDLMFQQARNAQYEQALVKTLIEALSEAKVIDANEVDARWNERCRMYAAEFERADRFKHLRAGILAAYRGTDKNVFTQCVEAGIIHLTKNETLQGVRELERAAALAISNTPLHSYLGRYFFLDGKPSLARDYLQRAFTHDPAHAARLSLLLGVACADDGALEQASELLNTYTLQHDASFAAHYSLGKIFAATERWPAALVEFKKALAARPSPEANYVVGCVYYQLDRNRMAERHLRKALSMDEHYAAAAYALGLVLLRAKNQAAARKALAHACALEPSNSLYRAASRSLANSKKTNELLVPLRQLFGTGGRATKKGLVTGGDARLAKLVREDALQDAAHEVVNSEPEDSAK